MLTTMMKKASYRTSHPMTNDDKADACFEVCTDCARNHVALFMGSRPKR